MENFSLDDLKKVKKLLAQEFQIANRIKAIDADLESLRNRRGAAEQELAAIKDELSKDQLAGLAKVVANPLDWLGLDSSALDEMLRHQYEADSIKIENPTYVTREDKDKLLQQILSDYQRENPKAKGMTFQQILEVLHSKYGIQTRTIGNFFKDQLEGYKTEGGNRRKYVLFSDRKKGDE